MEMNICKYARIVLFYSAILNIYQVESAKVQGSSSGQKNCEFKKSNDSNLIASAHGVTIEKYPTTVPLNENIKFRCKDIGEYLLNGSRVLTCAENGFTGNLPSCERLTEWKENSPPVILLGDDIGRSYVNDDGTLVLEKGSTISFSCYWPAEDATWSWNHKELVNTKHENSYEFWEGDSNLELWLHNVTRKYNGIYSCTIQPYNQTHGIHVWVNDTEKETTTSSTTATTSEVETTAARQPSTTTMKPTTTATKQPTTTTTKQPTTTTQPEPKITTTKKPTITTTAEPKTTTTKKPTTTTTAEPKTTTTKKPTTTTTVEPKTTTTKKSTTTTTTAEPKTTTKKPTTTAEPKTTTTKKPTTTTTAEPKTTTTKKPITTTTAEPKTTTKKPTTTAEPKTTTTKKPTTTTTAEPKTTTTKKPTTTTTAEPKSTTTKKPTTTTAEPKTTTTKKPTTTTTAEPKTTTTKKPTTTTTAEPKTTTTKKPTTTTAEPKTTTTKKPTTTTTAEPKTTTTKKPTTTTTAEPKTTTTNKPTTTTTAEPKTTTNNKPTTTTTAEPKTTTTKKPTTTTTAEPKTTTTKKPTTTTTAEPKTTTTKKPTTTTAEPKTTTTKKPTTTTTAEPKTTTTKKPTTTTTAEPKTTTTNKPTTTTTAEPKTTTNNKPTTTTTAEPKTTTTKKPTTTTTAEPKTTTTKKPTTTTTAEPKSTTTNKPTTTTTAEPKTTTTNKPTTTTAEPKTTTTKKPTPTTKNPTTTSQPEPKTTTTEKPITTIWEPNTTIWEPNTITMKKSTSTTPLPKTRTTKWPKTTTSDYSCMYSIDNNVMAFVNGSEVKSNSITIGYDESVTFRCIDVGRYQFNGYHTIRCNKLFHYEENPTCTLLDYRNKFSSPIITFWEKSNKTAITENGTLVIEEDSSITFSCWWLENLGKPKWQRNQFLIDDKNSAEFWEDGDKFVLQLSKVTRDQSGSYTCTTPYDKVNEIKLLVIPNASVTVTTVTTARPPRTRGPKASKKPLILCPINIEDNVIASLNGVQVKSNSVSIGLGEEIIFRCTDIGKFQFNGNHNVQCTINFTTQDIPTCKLLTNWDRLAAPVITFTIPDDQSTISENGTIIVEEGSIIELTCWWFKNNGEPVWLRNGLRIRDATISDFWPDQSKYSLHLTKTSESQTGRYTCNTPYGKVHEIELLVVPHIITTITPVATVSTPKSTTQYPPNTKPSTDFANSTDSPTTSNCTFYKDDSMMAFVNGSPIESDVVTIEYGEQVIFRCRNIERYQFRGNHIVKCNSEFNDQVIPSCQELDYWNKSSPPIITFNEINHLESITENGTIVVTEGSNITFSCWWHGNSGDPFWLRNDLQINDKNSLESWSVHGTFDLNLPGTSTDQSGHYTCTTPLGKVHGLDLLVVPYLFERCEFYKDDSLMAFVNGSPVELTTAVEDSITFRCIDIGRYKFDGNHIIRCNKNFRNEDIPTCTLLESRDRSSAPVISFDETAHQSKISENGTLIVTEGSDITFSCWWFKNAGDPHWLRNKLEVRDKNIVKSWKDNGNFEIELSKVSTDQSGYYTCTTPYNKVHGIDLLVLPKTVTETTTTTTTELQTEISIKNQKSTTKQLTTANPTTTKPGSTQLIADCTFYINDDMMAFVNGSQVQSGSVTIGLEDFITFRCIDIGRYLFRGNHNVQCNKRFQIQETPTCSLLDYWNRDSAPVITILETEQQTKISENGTIILAEGSEITFICWWHRSYGDPVWRRNKLRINDTNINGYWTGTGEFDLQLTEVTKSQSGSYTCTTPYGKEQGINLFVIPKEITETITPGARLMKDLSTTQQPTYTSTVLITDCTFYINDDMMAFVNGSQVQTSNSATVGLEDSITFRCRDIGRYQFHGNHIVQCDEKFQNEDIPNCTLLEQWDRTAAPAITFEEPTHRTNITENGTIIVTEGSALTFSCWWLRNSGDPKWLRNELPIEEENFHETWADFGKFDLELYEVSTDQSGYYTCTTPYGKVHGIDLLVVPQETTNPSSISSELIADCLLYVDDNVKAFVEGVPVESNLVTLDWDQSVTFRCSDIGRYQFHGIHTLHCDESFDDHDPPFCTHLDYRNKTSAPEITITQMHDLNTISDNGTIIIEEDSEITFSCWWLRNAGQPKWHRNNLPIHDKLSSEYWTESEKFDLELHGVSSDQSGYYTCTTPYGKVHGIDLLVIQKESATVRMHEGCALYVDDDVKAFVEGVPVESNLVTLDWDQSVTFRCIDIGRYQFHGIHTIHCNEWFDEYDPPYCTRLDYRNITSPPVITIEQMHYLSDNGTIVIEENSEITFSCWWFRSAGQPVWQRNGFPIHDKLSSESWEDQGKFNLHLITFSKEQSGLYTCTTPYGNTHGIDILVVLKAYPLTTSTPKTTMLPTKTRPTTTEEPIFTKCTYNLTQIDGNLVTYRDGSKVREELITVDLSESLTFHCRDIRKFAFKGDHTLTCTKRNWKGVEPHCITLQPWNEHLPPVVSYEVSGRHSISENGSLIVDKEADITLSCWWFQKYGEPLWFLNNEPIKANNAFEEWKDGSYLKLHVHYIEYSQSGYYSCKTPSDESHGIHLLVQSESEEYY